MKDKRLTGEEEQRLAYLLEEKDLEELSLQTVLSLLWRKGPYDPFFQKDGKKCFRHPFVHLMFYYKNIIFTLSDHRFIYMLFYLTTSILGFTVSEITYSFHLLDIVNRFDTLRNVIRSVTYNLRQLMLTGLLGLIMIYIYSIIGYNFIDNMYYDSDVSAHGERTCTSMLQCYLYTLNNGLKNGGGIGDALLKPSYAEGYKTTYYFRLFFDLTFFIIINIVFLNIIFGIIIDTFAELRDEKKGIDDDMQNKCYICNIDRYTFDKSGAGFEEHIAKHHYLWNYLILYLQCKCKGSNRI